MTMPSSQPAVVVVHGAWADGSSWSKVITALARRHIPVWAAPLPLTAFHDDQRALDRFIERLDRPVLLAGHAYAGAVIGASTHPHVNALAYIAALAPDEHETVADVFYRYPAHPAAPELAPDKDGLIWLPPNAFPDAFAPNATADEQAILAAVQRPINAACISVPVGTARWRHVPSWYLCAEQDRMITQQTQVFMAERMGATTVSHPVDHAPLITAAHLVADFITDAYEQVWPGCHTRG